MAMQKSSECEAQGNQLQNQNGNYTSQKIFASKSIDSQFEKKVLNQPDNNGSRQVFEDPDGKFVIYQVYPVGYDTADQ